MSIGGHVAQLPGAFDEDASAAWDAIASRLRAAGLLAALDRAALVLLCSAYVQYRRTLARLARPPTLRRRGCSRSLAREGAEA